jgi:predicted DNA-binding transcriptional regulator AlpA
VSVYAFTLVATGVDEGRLDALYEAGCDDAMVGLGAGTGEITFDREAPSLLQAISTAIDDVERAGASVVRVESDSLVWASQIAERFNRTRQSIDMLIRGRRGPGGFPRPAAGTSRNPLWRSDEIEDWFARYCDYQPDTERSTVVGAINGALEARRNVRTSGDPDLARSVQQLMVAA